MFELRVLNGQHEGAALPLSGEQWDLGNHEENDLQLCDEAIASLHAKLSRIEQAWQLTPNEGEVFLAHGQPVTDTLSLDVDQPFMLSGVWLVVSDASAPWQSGSVIPVSTEGKLLNPIAGKLKLKPSLPAWFKPALIMLGILGGIVLTSWFFMATPTQTAPRNLKPILADADAVRGVLVRKLEDRELNHAVRIEGDNQGLSLTGQITKTQSAILNRLMVSLSNDYEIHVPLRNATTLKILALPFRIVQITAGKHANIVTESGRRMFIGDVEDGFTLSTITKNSVQFTGPENISVKW